MKVILDTSGYSEFMRGHPEIKTSVQEAEEIFINPVILAELQAGFLRGERVRKNRRELRIFLSSPRVRLVDLDQETAERYAVIQYSLWTAGTPIPTNYIWIAATGMQFGLRVITTDSHYKKIPQIMVDWYPAS